MSTNTAIKTPRVEACIDAVMLRFPSQKSTAYYEAVHQVIAPLARDLEIENAALRAALEAVQPVAPQGDGERERFERAFGSKESFAWLNENGDYKVSALQSAWEIWQKAIAQRAGSDVDVIGDFQAEARQQKLSDFIASAKPPAIERDAARLDFLQTVLERNEYGPSLRVAGRSYEAETIREVLDAAMAAQQGEKGGAA
ncbi:hypothetical protein [Rugamonas sp.]|uniref:hypothetical protein n=1 Tax=Rugamonas sp. TaxID=1926287 RepID=UPI0025D5F4F7|nr:hypothetical protein [Rugamonas sp.]